MFNDNNSTVLLRKEAAVNSRSKHIDIVHQFMREMVRQHIIDPSIINTKEMPADLLTKAAHATVLNQCRILFGNVGWEEAEV